VALARVADFVGAVGVGLGMQDMQTHEFRSLGAAGISAELNPTYQRLAPGNRIWQEIGRRREPLTDGMVMPKEALVRTELYADWFTPQDFYSVMAFPALFKENASAVVVAFRSQTAGDFDAADLAELGRFADHFGRALGIRLDRERTANDLTRAQLALDAIQDAILLVDRDLRVRHANAAARAILDAGEPIRLHKGRLVVCDPKADAKLARILAGECGGELRPTGPALAGATIHIHPCVEALGGAGSGLKTVRITDLNRDREPPTPARLRDRLGLTGRQAQVAAELASGATEAEAAAKLELGAPTLHTHVRRIYEKLDLRSRAELIWRCSPARASTRL